MGTRWPYVLVRDEISDRLGLRTPTTREPLRRAAQAQSTTSFCATVWGVRSHATGRLDADGSVPSGGVPLFPCWTPGSSSSTCPRRRSRRPSPDRQVPPPSRDHRCRAVQGGLESRPRTCAAGLDDGHRTLTGDLVVLGGAQAGGASSSRGRRVIDRNRLRAQVAARANDDCTRRAAFQFSRNVDSLRWVNHCCRELLRQDETLRFLWREAVRRRLPHGVVHLALRTAAAGRCARAAARRVAGEPVRPANARCSWRSTVGSGALADLGRVA